MRAFSHFLFSTISGWKLEGKIDSSIKKCIIIVAPHTSWYDFYIAILVRKIIGLQIDFVAKKELFQPPFGWYFKWVGGTSLDRTPNQNKVEAIAGIFKSKDVFRLALSPEGTRKKVKTWKTGFYYIAKEAEVPIIMVSFDYGKKIVRFSDPFYTSSDKEKDFSKIYKFYQGVQGKNPAKFELPLV
ncbi:1-acyl-sn-glycerol-3-phosphate acyltransferase [Gillisia limnaea]|uniref:Phospholipid/glycerol acyltransferase n=1 Tax=Gillisia limnaea (strain DSM 15749 / LMG 21470 / R-8282) TaxID=865937 RepID=H2BYJ7_GILLR|nr:1-acyl-sn-glycerol-3-phosphate acyltransferase [Gillisia limnaea]EHQ01118.1 phospholipid/glycerol acyltransferase [Gillisia limnaea DSM 15749]